ncbi:hypothetical protein G6F37_000435 [Rhizopus arrhizus]|nr:hypothetical protein G6F38_007434 [Rhizopus arrhizus]KAG1164268.1 hypothetical protein G6F37_000435 [Rhizopus arrhizus]
MIRCKHYVRQPGVDIWGKSYTVNSLPSYECVNCQKSIASTRYAPHLEKCLGLAGRQSSRVASRRMNTASPFSSDDNNTASPESVDERMNKKKNNNKQNVSSNGVSRVKKLKYSE